MKSKTIALVLISSLLASCNKEEEKDWNEQEVYMRSDETANYCENHNTNMLLWYMAFRPYGVYNHGAYTHTGMYSNSISHTSNIGHSSAKSSVSSRGGFGSSSHSSSAS